MFYFKGIGGAEEKTERRTNVPALAQLAILTRSRDLTVSEFLNIFVKDIAPVGFRSAEVAIIEVRYGGERYSNRAENTDEEGKTRKLWRGDTQIGTLSVAFEGRDEASILPYEHDLIKSFASVLSLYLANREIAEHVSDVVASKIDEALESVRLEMIDGVSRLVHDFRGPLTGLVSMSSFLQSMGNQNKLPEDAKEAVGVILLATDRLGRQISAVVDYAKISSKETKLRMEAFALHSLIREVVAEIDSINNNKGLYFNTTIESAVPKYIVGDQTALRQILHNLIFNAFKYTDKGGISIAVAGEAKNDSSVEVKIAITDTGRGIPENDIPKIFNAFQRAGNQEGIIIPGHGLGLATVKAQVEKHGGTIAVVSQEGFGSTFTFNIVGKMPPNIGF